jgi:hypothetical protein
MVLQRLSASGIGGYEYLHLLIVADAPDSARIIHHG